MRARRMNRVTSGQSDALPRRSAGALNSGQRVRTIRSTPHIVRSILIVWRPAHQFPCRKVWRGIDPHDGTHRLSANLKTTRSALCIGRIVLGPTRTTVYHLAAEAIEVADGLPYFLTLGKCRTEQEGRTQTGACR